MSERDFLLNRGDGSQQFKPFGVFINIVKTFAGAGTFALPWAVGNAGLWGGIVGMLLVAVLSLFTIRTLLKCGERVYDQKRKSDISGNQVPPPSYPDIGRAAYGELGSMTISLFSALMCFGVCIAYYNLIGTNITQVLSGKFPDVQPWMIIAPIYPLTIFLSCLTDLTKLAYTSIAGSAALLIAMGSVIVYGIEEVKISNDYSVFEWKTIPLFLGGAAFLFCDHVVLIPLYNTCGDTKRFPRILDFAVIFVTVINVVFAAMSYAFFGNGICGNVISNLPDGSIVGDIVRVGISLEVMASFPLVANAGFQAIETGFHLNRIRAFPSQVFLNESPPFFSPNIWFYITRSVVILVLAVLAAAVKDFGLLVSLVGSLTIAATGFVFP